MVPTIAEFCALSIPHTPTPTNFMLNRYFWTNFLEKRQLLVITPEVVRDLVYCVDRSHPLAGQHVTKLLKNNGMFVINTT